MKKLRRTTIISRLVLCAAVMLSLHAAVFPQSKGKRLSKTTEYLQDLRFGIPAARANAVEKLAQTKDKKFVPVLIEALKDSSADVRMSAARGLQVMDAYDSLPELVNALSDPSKKVRKILREVVAGFTDLDYLKKILLEHENPQVREQAAVLLEETGDATVIPVLLKALNDNDFVRYAATKALGKLGDETTVIHLSRILNDPLGELRINAAKALVQLKAYMTIPLMFNLLDDKEIAVRTEVEQFLDDLISPEIILYYTEAALNNRSANIRKYCVKALGTLGNPVTVPLLIEAMRDKKKAVAEEAFRSLEIVADRSSIFNLCLALEDKDEEIRKNVITVLLKLGDPRAIPSLLRVVGRDHDELIRELAHGAVVELADNSVVDFFAAGLTNKNRNVRRCVAESIGKLKSLRLLPHLMEAYSYEKNHIIKITMLTTMRDIGDKSILPTLHKSLVSDKDLSIKAAIIVVLKDFGDYTSIPPLLECLKEGDEMLTLEAEEMLDNLVDEKSVKYFNKALEDKSFVVRSYAMKVIKKYPTSEVIPMAITAASDREPLIRRSAVEVLGIIGDRSALDVLVTSMDDKDEAVRAEAVKALIQVGDPTVIDLVMDRIGDKSSLVRAAIVAFLGKFGDQTVIPPLIKMLKKEDDMNIREDIINIFSELDAVTAIPVLLKTAVKDMEPDVRKASILVLGELGDNEIIPDLQDIFRDEFNSSVRATAITALAKLGAKEMMPEFMNLLSSDLREINGAAHDALNLLVEESDYSYLTTCLRSEQESIREYCLQTLARFRSKESLPDLFTFVKQKSSIRPKIMNIIDSIADRSYIRDYLFLVQDPMSKYDEELQLWVIKSIGRFRSKEGLDYLFEAMKSENYRIREQTVISMGKIGSAKTRKWLLYISENDTSFTVRTAAKEALGNIR